ncbi:hypothetical protein Clacol_000344 [Clathrus columnatus]|uniref:Uncharacterized protein n=1 Tax=Clathrus columnatus TaxID=1419009 RepID=A0AAV4ZZI7_9AGAM|nr:hypothetical protein Clacol_000344 [Clathrus columnatus]
MRTYALCRGYQPMTVALSITFLVLVAIQIYYLSSILFLIRNIAIVVLDILAFTGVSYQVLGSWKSKRSFQSGENLTMALFRQGVVRFSFVLLLTNATTFLIFFGPAPVANPVSSIENVLSVLLICEHTIDLRRRGTRASVADQSGENLPTSSFQNNPAQPLRPIAERLHESIEMGEIYDLTDVDNA